MAAPARYNLTQPLPKFRHNLNFDIVVKFQNDRHKDRKISRGLITRARNKREVASIVYIGDVILSNHVNTSKHNYCNLPNYMLKGQ